MSNALIANSSQTNKQFWKNATKYASIAEKDENFVGEIAYMMVTLHRNGA